jgi:hypothetical protein
MYVLCPMLLVRWVVAVHSWNVHLVGPLICHWLMTLLVMMLVQHCCSTSSKTWHLLITKAVNIVTKCRCQSSWESPHNWTHQNVHPTRWKQMNNFHAQSHQKMCDTFWKRWCRPWLQTLCTQISESRHCTGHPFTGMNANFPCSKWLAPTTCIFYTYSSNAKVNTVSHSASVDNGTPKQCL